MCVCCEWKLPMVPLTSSVFSSWPPSPFYCKTSPALLSLAIIMYTAYIQRFSPSRPTDQTYIHSHIHTEKETHAHMVHSVCMHGITSYTIQSLALAWVHFPSSCICLILLPRLSVVVSILVHIYNSEVLILNVLALQSSLFDSILYLTAIKCNFPHKCSWLHEAQCEPAATLKTCLLIFEVKKNKTCFSKCTVNRFMKGRGEKRCLGKCSVTGVQRQSKQTCIVAQKPWMADSASLAAVIKE